MSKPEKQDFVPKFEISLVLKGNKVGVIEAVGFKEEDGAQRMVFSGYLLRALEKPEVLIRLLKAEGIHLGKG